MKRLSVKSLSLVLALTVGGLFALGSSTAEAQPGPAVVIKGEYCKLFAGDGSLYYTTDKQVVVSNDRNGNVKVTCHMQLPADRAAASTAVHFNFDNTGYPCDTGYGLTYEWKAVVTSSGRSMLVCHINP